MTNEQKAQQYREFVSMILSCQLAVEFNKSRPNKAIKHTLKKVKDRITSENVKILCDMGLQSVFPAGWLAGQLNKIERYSDMSKDDFLDVGAIV